MDRLIRIAPILALAALGLRVRGSAEPAVEKSRLAPLTEAVSVSVGNAYIEAVMDDRGRFTIGTVEGDPTTGTDNDKILLFGHPNPWSSETMLRVDGSERLLETGTVLEAPAADGGSIRATFRHGTIDVTETLSIVGTRGMSGNPDTFKISFKAVNTDTVAHTISLRTQLDTMLGNNDGAPFRILEGNVGGVTSDLEFDNDPLTSPADVPGQAIVFDNLSTPTVISLLTFDDGTNRAPDRVVFGSWGKSYQDYDYAVVPGDTFSDSSVVAYWGQPSASPITLAAGSSVEFSIFYGLGGMRFFAGYPFNVGMFAPGRFAVETQGLPSYRYVPNPFSVTLFFENISGAAAAGGEAEMRRPSELVLASGQAPTVPIEGTPGSGSVAAGEIVQANYNLTTFGRHLGRSAYALEVRYPGRDPWRLGPFIVEIPGIANSAWGQATDTAGNPRGGSTVELLQGGTLIGTDTTEADGTYYFGGLSPGRYQVRISGGGLPDMLYDAVVSDDPGRGYSTPLVTKGAGASLEAFAYPNPARDGVVNITFFLPEAAGGRVRVFSFSNELVAEFPADGGPGWRSVAWPVEQVANGGYLFEVEAGGKTARGKIAVMKKAPRP